MVQQDTLRKFSYKRKLRRIYMNEQIVF